MASKYISNSKIYHISKALFEHFGSLENKIESIYKNSLLFRLNSAIKIKDYCKESIFYISGTRTANREVLRNSKTFQIAETIFRNIYKNMILNYKESKILSFLTRKIYALYNAPIRQISAVLILAIISNIVFNLALQYKVSNYGWFLRFYLLIISFCGLTFMGSIDELFRNSTFFKIINGSKHKK